VIEVEEDQTILDAALRAGVYLPHACGHGLCGTCKVQVLEGEVEHGDASPFALMDVEREEGKCLACTARPLSDLVIEADVEEDPDAERHPVRDYVGTVVRIEDPCPRIRVITMELPGEGMDFQAGQYINLDVPGVDGPRAFSMANPPSQRNIVELHVCKVPGGAATTWLHEELKEGMTLSFTGPYGRFFVRKSAPNPVLFLAGGTGITAPKSMILDLLENGDTRGITLIHGVRNQAELYTRGLFEELARKHENFRYVPVLSDEPEDSDWQGRRGFVHEVAKEIYGGRFEGLKAYLCGPPPMVEACVTTLMRGRLFEKDIYAEQFLTRSPEEERKRSPLFKVI
jgi:phenol hydroxylase P5 protein